MRAGSLCSLAVFAVLTGAIPNRATAEPSYGEERPPSSVLEQLDQLAAQRPGVVDMYAIVVGADSNEDVFRKEVATVRNVLDQRLGTKNRSVTLVNRRSAPAPEATLKSLEYVINRVAAKMNRDEDILFLHFTTHGAANHALYFNHPALELYGLTPTYLHALLENARVRYRVIFISACYSGGFVPPLANTHTLVITSASATLQSSGCGDKSEITNYSRAFYLKALPQAHSLKEAARLAQEIVHLDERKSNDKHSFPQMQIGGAIEQQLRRIEEPHLK